MTKSVTNIAASVRQRLRNLANENGRDFEKILLAYGLERVLHRLSQSRFRDRFVLKGGLLVIMWTKSPGRFTQDADFLDDEPNEEIGISDAFAEIFSIDSEDGLLFNLDTFNSRPIMADKIPNCKRVKIVASLDDARINISLDVGTGDSVHVPLHTVEYPSLLDFPPIRLRAYSPENVVSEKFLAMAERQSANSRMKDYYDLYTMSRNQILDFDQLTHAIRATFDKRGMTVPADRPRNLSDGFARERQSMWEDFTRSTELAGTELADILEAIWSWLGPICHEINGLPQAGESTKVSDKDDDPSPNVT